MNDKKFIGRFCAGMVLVSIAYFGGKTVIEFSSLDAASTEKYSIVLGTETAKLAKRPNIVLTNGEVIDPETAPVTKKYEDSTAKEFALESFEGEETPDLSKFLSRFLCNACGKACLLSSPSCLVGKKTEEKAVALYQELYPEVEISTII